MKKVNLLSRAEMRKVMGGDASASSCTASCPGGKSVSCSGTTCTAIDGTGCYGAGPDDAEDRKDCKKD